MIKKKCGKISLSKLGISFKKCWGALYLSIFMDWNNWTIGKAIQHRVVVCQWQVLLAIVLPYTHRLLKCHKRTATQTYQDVMAHDRPKSPIGSSSDARVTRICGRSLSIQKWDFFGLFHVPLVSQIDSTAKRTPKCAPLIKSQNCLYLLFWSSVPLTFLSMSIADKT